MRNLSRTMIGRLTALLLMGVLVAVMTGACGSDPTATPAPTATPVPPTATPVIDRLTRRLTRRYPTPDG